MSTIIDQVRQELKENADPSYLENGKKFFKEEIISYGMKVPVATQIGKKYFKEIKNRSKTEIFDLCEILWQSGYLEESFIACNWSYELKSQYEPADFKVFERWVKKYLSNWASCDTLCNHTIGDFIMMYPQYVSELKKWATSNNRWVKRAAAVTLIIPARKGMFLNDVLEIAAILLLDKDDLVQKGYGWMLKAASMTEKSAEAKKCSEETRKEHLEAVFNFIMKHKTVMPRTALRYAIEKMPEEWKIEAMKK